MLIYPSYSNNLPTHLLTPPQASSSGPDCSPRLPRGEPCVRKAGFTPPSSTRKEARAVNDVRGRGRKEDMHVLSGVPAQMQGDLRHDGARTLLEGHGIASIGTGGGAHRPCPLAKWGLWIHTGTAVLREYIIVRIVLACGCCFRGFEKE